MSVIISHKDAKLIDHIKREHLAKYGFPIIEGYLTHWYFIYDENDEPIAGMAVAMINEESYPFVAEGIKPESIAGINPEKTRELTNFFSFRDDRWLVDLVELAHVALSDFDEMGLNDVILFTHRPIYRFLRMKQGFDISFIQPSIKVLDVDSALSRLKDYYGNTLEYSEEENYLKRHKPRGVMFKVEQALASIKERNPSFYSRAEQPTRVDD